MNIKTYEIEIPVVVSQVWASDGSGSSVINEKRHTLKVRITVNSKVTVEEAVDELARRIERVCKLGDWTGGWDE